MQNVMLTVFPIILLILTFYGAKLSKKGTVSDTFIDLTQSKNIQAFACIAIIMHHLTQQITVYGMRPKGPITLLNYVGYLFTALFFFFSGYGLITSLNSKPDYLKTFLKRRLPAVLVPFWFINILAVILISAISSRKAPVSEIICDITGITLINSNGWFIIEIVLLYVFFYILFRFIKNRKLATALLCLVTVLMIIFSFLQGHDPDGSKSHWFRGEWWFNSTISFAFGLIFPGIKDKFADFCVKRYAALVTALSVLLAISISAGIYAQRTLGYYHEPVHGGVRDAAITLVIQSISCIIAIIFMLVLNTRLSLGNRSLRFISGLSLELFLVHGYFVDQIFGNVEMSDFLRFLSVIGCSILATVPIAMITRFLVKKLTALLCTKRIKNNTLERAIAEKRRAKQIRVIGILAAILAVIAVLYITVGRIVIQKGEYSKELEQLNSAGVGDTVQWGHCDMDPVRPGTERISWIVLAKDADSLLLISQKGLAGSYYHQKHQEISWKDSDLRKLLTSDKFMKCFSSYESRDMMPIDGDPISLLTVSEAEKYFESDAYRELVITDIAKAQGTNVNDMSKHHYWDMTDQKTSWWWLRGDNNEKALTAPIVTVDGVISPDEKYVNKPGGAIRPVIRVKITTDETETVGFSQYNSEGESSFPYLLYSPDSKEKLPLVITFHGYGADTYLADTITNVTLTSEESQKTRPCYVLAPAIDDSIYLAQSERDKFYSTLREISDKLISEGKVDKDRIYIMGNSFGGLATVEFAEKYPDYVAGALVMCPALTYCQDTINNLKDMKDVPTWFLHATNDNVIPIVTTRSAVSTLDALGAKEIRFTEFSNAEMDAVGAAYGYHEADIAVMADEQFLNWLFEARLFFVL